MPFRPGRGQVALVERDDLTAGCVTGLIGAADDDHVEIDLGLGGALPPDGGFVVVSVCAPDALYRLRATPSAGNGDGILVLTDIEQLGRIQRRTAVRVPIRLGVTLSYLDDASAGLRSVTGFTVDVGVGGLQVQTLRPLPGGDPTAMLELPDGMPVVALTVVLQTTRCADGYRSRLAFQDLEGDAMTALSSLVEEASRTVVGA